MTIGGPEMKFALFCLMSLAEVTKAAEIATPDERSASVFASERIDWSSDLCATQKSYLEAEVAARLTPEQLAAAIAKKSPKVILVGETHAEQTPEYYRHLFPKLKKAMPGLNCVAFETNEEMIKKVGLRPTWTALRDVAKKSFARAYYVDKYFDEHEEADSPDSPAAMAGGLNERSRRMAGHLQKLLKSGSCTKILMINGSGHLSANPGDQRPGIPQRLNKAGVSTFNILTVDLVRPADKRAHNVRDPWVWPKGPGPDENWGSSEPWKPKCADVPGRIGENYAFLNADQPLAKRVPITYYNSQFGSIGPISQFDAVLMLQCPERDATRCD